MSFPQKEEWKHTYAEYKDLLNLPLGAKIERAHMLIIEHLQKYKRNVVACSWGKDSIVLLHLVRDFCPNVKVVFHNTGVEYPQNLEYRNLMLKEWGITNYEETKPLIPFWECVTKYGYPDTRQMASQGKRREPKCCLYLKNKPAQIWCKENNIELEFVGLQASESMVRRLSFLREGESFYSKTHKHQICRPLMVWTDKDIWGYQKLYNIPRNKLYDIMPRNGCMPCTGFKGWSEVMVKANPKLYNFISMQKGMPSLDCFRTEELEV